MQSDVKRPVPQRYTDDDVVLDDHNEPASSPPMYTPSRAGDSEAEPLLVNSNSGLDTNDNDDDDYDNHIYNHNLHTINSNNNNINNTNSNTNSNTPQPCPVHDQTQTQTQRQNPRGQQPSQQYYTRTGEAVMVYSGTLPLWRLGRTPAPVDCPACGRREVMTRTALRSGNHNHVLAATICFFTCMGPVAYWIRSVKDVDHYCGRCSTLLTTWHRSGAVELHVDPK